MHDDGETAADAGQPSVFASPLPANVETWPDAPTDEIRTRVDELREIIERARFQYYQQDAPELPDAVYDSLERELETIENRYPELRTASRVRRSHSSSSSRFMASSIEYIRTACWTGSKLEETAPPTVWVGDVAVRSSG